MKIACAHCGKQTDKSTSEVNRARKAGLSLYCDRACSGLGRRKHRAAAQKIEEKRAYDAARRVALADEIKAQKAAYHKRTYDPVKAAAEQFPQIPEAIGRAILRVEEALAAVYMRSAA